MKKQKEFIDYLKVGTKVKSLLHGEGVVTKIGNPADAYPIVVRFKDFNGFSDIFTKKGFNSDENKFQCLYLAETELNAETVMVERGNIHKFVPKEGDLVWVKDPAHKSWHCAYFSSYDKGRYYTYLNQAQSGDAQDWYECHPYDERPF